MYISTMSTPAPQQKVMVLASDIVSIMSFGEQICGVRFDIGVYICNNVASDPWFDLAEISLLLSISHDVLKKFKTRSDPSYFHTNFISEDGLMELLFTNSSPLALAFRKFVKVVIKKLFATGNVNLTEVKISPDIEKYVAAVVADRDFLESIHNKNCESIAVLNAQLAVFQAQNCDKNNLNLYKNDRSLARYTQVLEKRYLKNIYCWAVEWFEEEDGLPKYDLASIDEYDTVYMRLTHSNTNPGNATLIGKIYYKNIMHILKCTNRTDKLGVITGCISDIRTNVIKQVIKCLEREIAELE